MFQNKYVPLDKIPTFMTGGGILTHMAQDLGLYSEMKPMSH